MTCVLCGVSLGSAKFVVPSGKRVVHVCCEQSILDEPLLNLRTGMIYEYGIRMHGENTNFKEA